VHAGHTNTWDPGSINPPTYTFTENGASGNDPQTKEESGLDWFNAVTPMRENGKIVAYCAVGYSTHLNWWHDNDCGSVPAWEYPLPFYGIPGAAKPETHARMARGIVLCTAALLDLQGQVIWYKTFNMGILNGVIQDANGDLVMTGTSASWRPLTGDPAHTIRVNPYDGTGGTDLGQDECIAHKEKLCVMKMNLDGDILWNYRYTPFDPGTQGFTDMLNYKAAGYGVTDATINGEPGYRVVGNQVFNGNDGFRPYVLELDADGNIQSNVLYDAFPVPGYDAFQQGEARGVASFTYQGQELHAITGYRFQSTVAPPGEQYANGGAFLWVRDDQGATLFFKDTYIDAAYFNTLPDRIDLSGTVTFAEESGAPTIVWPVLVDYTSDGSAAGNVFAGNHEATGKVYKFDLAGNPLWSQVPDLGIMRAFDLHFAAVQDRDKHIAVASTKWSPDLGFQAPDQPVSFAGLDPQTQGYLTGASGLGYAYNANGDVVPWAFFSDPQFHATEIYVYGYWFTDSYTAKLRIGDGSLVWETQWDSYEGPSELEFPGNFRQRQCNFDIVEAHDGGLIVVGNTGHNFDDAYIAKLGPCDRLADYIGPLLDANNQYIVGVNETWTTDMRVKGSIVIQNGRTLTIDGATIEFADTRKVGITTNIEVRQGGRLIIENGAHLTSLQECPESMWDGIMAPRNTSIANNTTPYIEITDSRISNALVWVWLGSGDPLNPLASTSVAGPRGYVVAERSQFENNRISLLSNSYTTFANPGLFSDITACGFTQNAPLNYPNERLQHHAYIIRNRTTRFYGCSFSNELAWDEYVNNPEWWGTGIWGIDARLTVEDMPDGTQSQFRGMGLGVRAQPSTSGLVKVDHALFVDNARGILLSSVPNARITRNLFLVPDHDVSVFGGLLATYGTFLNGATGFELEENVYLGSSATAHPKVGAAFKGTGPNNNTYYNNRFDRFRDVSVSSAGTIIQANNGNSSPNSGLHFKCNDYGNDHINDYDIAFTGPGVTIGPIQGANGPDDTDPAGNTFTPNSNASLERHLFVDQGINNFIYWHHDPLSTTQVVRPESYTTPPILASWLLNSGLPYEKEDACPVDLSGMMLQGPEQVAQAASTELQVLEEVYADWRDGGDTEGLKDFILDPANNSYALRNELMLLAPKVSAENWALVFERIPAMTAWHLAQALVANSPLERATLELLENSTVDPYYVQLVKCYQNGGVSMHDLQKSDIAHFHGKKSTALDDLLAAALASGEEQDLSDAFTIIEAMDHETEARHLVALLVAQGAASAARAIVSDALASDPGNASWTVMDMLLVHMENGTDPADADAATVAYLESLAATEEPGYADAQAWLALLGQEFPEGLILPGGPKSRGLLMEERLPAPPPSWLQAAPNPSSGPLQLICTLPDGAERGEVAVMDAMGRVMVTRSVAPHGAILELDMRNWATGTYLANLVVDGINAGSIKLQRMK